MFFKRLEDVTNRLHSSQEPRNEFSDVADGQGSQSRAQTPPTGDNCKYFEPKTGQLIEGEALIHAIPKEHMPGGWPIDIAEDATESGIINASEQVKDDSDSELSQLDEVEFLRSFLAYKGQLQSNGRVAPIATMTANGASQPEVYSAEILEDDYDFEIFANASEEIFWDDDFEVFSDASEEILEDGQNPKSVHTQETDFEGEYTSDAAIENRSGADKAINTGDISDNVTSDNAEDTPANLQAGDPVDDFDIFMADVGPLSDNVTSKATGFVEDTPGRDIQAAGAILASAIEEHTFEAYDTFLNVETTEDQDSAQDFFIEQHKSEVHDASLTVGINSQTNSATPTNNQNSYIEDTVQDGDFKTHDTTFKSTIESQLSGHNDQRSFSDNVGAASEAINSIIEENAILNSVVEQHIATTNTSVGHNNPANGPETTKGDNNVSSDAVAIPTDEKSSAAKVPVPSFGHIPKSTRPDIASNPTLCHKPYKQEEVTKMMELYQERASRSHIRKKNLAVIDWRNLVDTYNVIFPQRMRSKNALQCRVKKELKKARKMKERTPPAPTSAPIDGDVGPTEEASTEAGIAGPFADGLERGDGPLEEPKIKWVYPKLDDNRYLEGTKYDKSGKPEGWINDPNDNEDSTDRATISIETLQKLNVFKLPTSSLFFSEEEIVYFTELANLLMETYCVPLQQLDLELLFNSFRYFRKHHHITPSPERTNGEIYKLYLRQINHGVRNNSLTLRRQAEYERRMNLKPGTIHADTPRLYTPIEVAERANAVAWVLLKMDPNIDLNNRRDLAEMFGQGEHPISILEMGIVGTYPGLKPFSKSATEWREIAAAKRLKLPKRNRYSTKDEPIQLVSDSEDDFDDEVIPEGHVVWEYLASEAIIIRGLVRAWLIHFPGVNIDWKIIQQCFNVSNKAEHCCGRWRTGRELRHEWNDMYPEYAELIKQGRIAEVPPEFEFESQMKRLKAKGTRRKLRDDNEGENAEDIERELKKLRQEEEDSNADDERDEEEVSAGRSKRKRDHNDDSHGSGKKPKVSFFEADCDDNNAQGPTKRKANSFTIEESEDNKTQSLSKKPKTTNFLEHDTTDYLPWEEEATPFIIQDE